MKLIKSIAIIVFVVAVCFAVLNKKPVVDSDIKHIRIGDTTLNVELALTPEVQAQGLSGRTLLKPSEGMLFVFPKVGKYSFWMKDMNFPIDMIWIDENQQVIYMAKYAQPASYPNSFTPTSDAKYVLEVVSGFADTHDLSVGDKVSLSD